MANIRKMQPADLNSVAEIARQAFPAAKSTWYFQQLVKKYPNDFYVAEKDGGIVGYVLGHVKREGLGWIKTIAVSPDYQGQGLGIEMMSFITDKLKTAGASTLALHTRTNNKNAISFYQKLGFQKAEEIANYYRNGDSAYRMEKEI